MKLLLIFVVISIYTSDVAGFLTTAEVKCKPRYNGGYGGAEGAYVIPRWTFNPGTNHCEVVMVKVSCKASHNCFSSEFDCEYNCDPKMESWKQELIKG
uniref:Putative salivary kunitz domain protein n=1 Tax=Ixodes ricinus TaxID=34613 RepID=A0A0K8RDG5_IXORI